MLSMIFDILTNIVITCTLEMPLGNEFFTQYAIEISLISESIVRCIKLLIILQICNVFELKYIGLLLGIEFVNMLLQIEYKDSESGLIRFFSTVTLLLSFGFLLGFPDYNNLSQFTNTNILAIILIIQTMVDGFDFPDKLSFCVLILNFFVNVALCLMFFWPVCINLL